MTWLGRWVIVPFLIFIYLLHQAARWALCPRHLTMAWAGRISKFWGGPITRLLGVRIVEIGQSVQGPHILVANHVSWIDPIAITGQTGVLWITSDDTRRDPLLGTVCRLAASPFVSRSAWSLKEEVESLQSITHSGVPLGFFPEATTGDGSALLPFRPAFFEVALLTGVPIQPLCLQWTHLDGKAITRQDADAFFYFGGTSFFANLREVLRHKTCTLELRWLPPLNPADYSNRKQLASAAENLVKEYYTPISFPEDAKNAV